MDSRSTLSHQYEPKDYDKTESLQKRLMRLLSKFEVENCSIEDVETIRSVYKLLNDLDSRRTMIL